jgi:uncharacterized repeat protein (TIGR01451 family)
VVVGLLGLSTGGALTVINAASAQTDALSIAATAEPCSPIVKYTISPPSDVAADPSASPHYALSWRADGTAEWTPAPDEKVEELTALTGELNTALAEDSDVTVRVQALDAASVPTGDAAYASTALACDEWQTDSTTTTTIEAESLELAALVEPAEPITQGVRIYKSGTRGASDESLDGATMALYTGTNASPFQTLVGTCVTGSFEPGACEITAPVGSGYYVKELTAPPGYELIPEIGLGGATSDLDPTKQPYARGFTNTGVYAPYASPITVSANQVRRVPQTSEASTTPAPAFANRRINPPFPDSCGLKLGIVFDLSTSINETELGQMQQAATGFVEALDATPSEISLYGFSTTAIDVATANPRPVADPGIITDIGDLDDHAGGSTNYDAAFRQIPSGLDAVAFLTDGNPNVYGVNGSGTNSTTFASIEQAVLSANTVKSFGTKIMGVGIGAAASEVNLKPISGPTLNDDYFLAAGFSELEQTLADLATQLCGGSVSVKKLVKDPGTGAYAPAAGWQFDASSAPAASPVVTPADGITGDDGIANFKYSAGTDLAVTVSETLQPGFALAPQGADVDARNATCTRNGDAVPPAQIQDAGSNGVTLTVGPTDIVSCEFRNDPNSGSITIKKITADGDQTTPFSFTSDLTTDPPGGAFALTGGGSQVFSVAPGTYHVAEEDPGPIGWRLSSLGCIGNGPGGGSSVDTRSATIVVVPDGNVTCEYQNTPQTATVRVRKFVDGEQTAAWTVDASVPDGQTTRFGAAAIDESVQTPSNGATAFTGLTRVSTTGSTVDLAEVQQTGFTPGTVHCTAEGETQDGAAGSIGLVITPGDDWTCTFKNSLNTAKVTVVKDVDGTPVADWTFDGALPNPGSAFFRGNGEKSESRTTAGNPIPDTTFTVDRIPTGGTSALTLTEQLQAGFLFDQVLCVLTNQGDEPLSEVIGGSPEITFPVTAGNEILCTFENSSAPGTITIVKDANPQSEQPFEFTSTGGLTPGDSFELTDGGDQPQNTAEFTDLAPSTYTVTESDPNVFGWTLDEIACEGSAEFEVVSRTVTIDLGAGESLLCTYTNTRNDANVTVIKEIGAEPVEGWEFDAELGSGAPPAHFAGGGTQTSISTAGDPAHAELAIEQVPAGGVSLAIEELLQVGYAFDEVTCRAGDQVVATAQAPDPAQIVLSLAPGDDVVCTFTNHEVPGTITIVKSTGTSEPRGFEFATTGGAPLPSTFSLFDTPADESIMFTDVPAGTYTVTEDDPGPLGWALTELTCTDGGSGVVATRTATIELEPAASVTCTFTDEPTTARIAVVKLVDGAQTAAWTVDATIDPAETARFGDDDLSASAVTDTVVPAAYPTLTRVSSDGSTVLLEEQHQDGFTDGPVSCESEGGVNVDGTTDGEISLSVRPDDAWVCTFENVLNTATVEVVKEVSGTGIAGWTFAGTVTGGPAVFDNGLTTQSKVTADPGPLATFELEQVPDTGAALTLEEQLQAGYSFAGVVCAVIPDAGDAVPIGTGDSTEPVADVDVFPGQLVRCTFTNNILPASILVTKTGASSVNAGSDTSFSVLVTNNGEVPLTNVVVTDTLPTETSFVSAAVVSGNPGTCAEAAKVVTCTLDGTFEVDETSTLSIVVNVPSATTALTITNVVDVTGDPPSCPPVSLLTDDVAALASECPVTSTDDATVPVITVGGETVVDVPLVLSGSLPFTGPAGLAALKSAAWLLAIGGFLSIGQRRRRTP